MARIPPNRLENQEVKPATPGSGLQSIGLSTTPLLTFPHSSFNLIPTLIAVKVLKTSTL